VIIIWYIPMASLYWGRGKECHGSIPSTWRFPLHRTEVYSPPDGYPLCAQNATAAQAQRMIVVVHLLCECVGWSGIEVRFEEKYKFVYTFIMPSW